MIVFGLRAGWSIKEMMSHEDIKKSTVKDGLKRKIGELFATGESADVFMTIRKVCKRLSNCMWTFLAASLEKLIPKDPHEDLGAEAEHFQGNCEERHCWRT